MKEEYNDMKEGYNDINEGFNNINEGYNNMNESYNYIIDNIKELYEEQLIEVYKIIKLNNIKHTINSNGIFIDLKLISNNIIIEIINLIKYLKNTKI
jgi:hypothetical protein